MQCTTPTAQGVLAAWAGDLCSLLDKALHVGTLQLKAKLHMGNVPLVGWHAQLSYVLTLCCCLFAW